VSWDRHSVGERPLFVWAPDDRSRTYPVVYVLHSHMRNAASWFNVEPFEESYPEAIERLAPAAIVALVDGWTEHGGGQWIGALGEYLRDDVVPFVEERYPANGSRALQGKSSGAYGALVHAFTRPHLFHAVAAHAPMALFEVTVAHDFALAARELRERGLASFDGVLPLDGLKSPGDAILVEVASLAYAFSDGVPPFDLRTGALVAEVWERWLEHDPLRIARSADLGALRGVWLDAGRRDEYFLDLGALALHDELLANGLPEERLRFELFDGGHRGVSGRYPSSLDYLIGSLSITF
jgi:Putative esterase